MAEPEKRRHWTVIAAGVATCLSCLATAVTVWTTHATAPLLDVAILAVSAFFVFKQSRIAIVVLILYSFGNIVYVIHAGGKPGSLYVMIFILYCAAAWNLFAKRKSQLS